jgi:hypothetical protein
VPPVDGSPMITAAYPENSFDAPDSPDHADEDSSTGVYPSAVAAAASALDAPPFTDEDKISTEPSVDARAGGAVATTAAAAPAVTAPATATGTSDVLAATTGPSATAVSRRLC